jgi:hypothetical protein
MPKTKKKTKPSPRKTAEPAARRRASPAYETPAAPDGRILASNLTLHDLFQQQTTAMLDRADLSDEQRQNILIAMNCPCCGAGGMSFTAKLKRGR